MKTLFILITYVITSFSNLTFTSALKNLDGTPISNAFIKEKQSVSSTKSDEDGNFVLKPHSKDAILVISKVGYEALEVRVRETANIIFLKPLVKQ
jgi:hypothetical protein